MNRMAVGEFRLTPNDSALLIGFDDGGESNYSAAMPILYRHDSSASCFLVTGVVGSSPNTITWQEVAVLYQKGWNICNHTQTHADLTTLSEVQQETEILTAANELFARGYEQTSKFVAYPYGAFNNDTLVAMQNLGMLLGRSVGSPVLTIPPDNVFILPSGATIDVATCKQYLDDAIANKTICSLYIHQIGYPGTWTIQEFQSFVDYWAPKRKLAPMITMGDYYQLLTTGSVIVGHKRINSPNRLSVVNRIPVVR